MLFDMNSCVPKVVNLKSTNQLSYLHIDKCMSTKTGGKKKNRKGSRNQDLVRKNIEKPISKETSDRAQKSITSRKKLIPYILRMIF